MHEIYSYMQETLRNKWVCIDFDVYIFPVFRLFLMLIWTNGMPESQITIDFVSWSFAGSGPNWLHFAIFLLIMKWIDVNVVVFGVWSICYNLILVVDFFFSNDHWVLFYMFFWSILRNSKLASDYCPMIFTFHFNRLLFLCTTLSRNTLPFIFSLFFVLFWIMNIFPKLSLIYPQDL